MPGKFHGQRSLPGYRPWGHKESDMTKHAWTHTYTCYVKNMEIQEAKLPFRMRMERGISAKEK